MRAYNVYNAYLLILLVFCSSCYKIGIDKYLEEKNDSHSLFLNKQ